MPYYLVVDSTDESAMPIGNNTMLVFAHRALAEDFARNQSLIEHPAVLEIGLDELRRRIIELRGRGLVTHVLHQFAVDVSTTDSIDMYLIRLSSRRQ
jgi:hypothetical protein